MAIAAVPAYVGKDFSKASPGVRFGMYLQLWGTNNRTGEMLWSTFDINYRRTGGDHQEREFRDENKTAALDHATRLTADDKRLMKALAERQVGLAAPLQATGQLVRIEAVSIAPFTTGLGNEHPLENGFAFLNPYGLPYLPGSGVKGVLRQAARELASGEWGEMCGWDPEERYILEVGKGKKRIRLSMIDALFGKQTGDRDTDHVRGALAFWDVFPQISGNTLSVEVMTPHQTHYYQKGESPHESGSPNPINFLTVPSGSDFAFHIECDRSFLSRVAPELALNDRWQAPLEAAFEHAFGWCGFGAKTAVGYGAMERDKGAEEKHRDAAQKKAQLDAMSPLDREMQEVERLGGDNPGAALMNAVKKGRWDDGGQRVQVAKRIRELWENQGRWIPDFAGTNKKKVEQRDRCREVLEWLRDA